MKKISVLGIFIVITLLLITVTPAQAIIAGEPDEGRHPYVGLMFSYGFGQPVACSGTLLSPTVFLTAGHCTALTNGDDVYIWFQEALPFMPLIEYFSHPWDFPGYEPVKGTAYTYPEFTFEAFALYDAGIVVLDEPVEGITEFGILPEAGVLNVLQTQRGLQDTTFTNVGYGYQAELPGWESVWEPKRMVAYPNLIQINAPGHVADVLMLVSCNPDTGGASFIDSGSPNFLGDSRVIAGMVSGGNQGTMGWISVFRLDQEHILDWIESFLN